jgi:probable F420-dependent oxidoreductase
MKTVALSAESLGYDSLWLNEFLATEPGVLARFDDPPTYLDAIVTMAFLSDVTSRVRFFTSTIVLPLHEPALLAKQIASLDFYSRGRVTLGIGLGGSADEFRTLRGELQSPNRGQMLDEYLDALRLLWTERRATYSGKYVAFENLEMYPKPVQDPVPIYMAGTADGVYRRIAHHGQGWIDTFLLPDALAEAIETIRAYWSDAGRAGQPDLSRQFYLSIDPDESKAKENFERSLPAPRPAAAPPPNFEMTLVGTPARIADRLAEYVAVGVTEVCAIFYSPDVAGALRQMELFAHEVAPALQGG